MAYTDTQNVKNKLGIDTSDTSMDQQIDYYIDNTKPIMDTLLWCDLTTKKQRKDTIKYSNIYKYGYNYVISLSCPNVDTIDTIDGNVYTWIKWEDYKITWYLKNEVYINQRFTTTPIYFELLEIEYTAWYDTAPQELSFAQDMLVEWLISQKLWRDIVSEKSWPRTVQFASKEDSKIFKDLIKLYTPILNVSV